MGLQKVTLGQFEVERKGEKIQYVLENLSTDAEMDEAVDHMVAYFLPREPMCAYTKLKDDPKSLNSIITLWRKGISEGTGIGAYLINNDGSKGKLIGVNMTLVGSKEEKDEKFEGEAFNDVLEGVVLQIKASNLYGKYGVDKYLSAFGLSVHPDFHGCQLGYRILQSRENICKHLGLGVTGTVFTAGASQHLAAKLGFETLVDWDYKQFQVNGKFPFYNMGEEMDEKSSKMMALEYK